MTPNNGMKDLPTGVKCKGDHSKLLCGSGNAYYYAARAVQKVTKVVSDSVDKQFDSVNESVETVCYFQDIPVVGHNYMARTFWDEGSNRVLIRQDFADKLGLVKKEIRYSLEAVGQEPEFRTGFIYMLSIMEMYGRYHSIWGYSIEKFMVSSVPDLSHIESFFPRVPKETFKAMNER